MPRNVTLDAGELNEVASLMDEVKDKEVEIKSTVARLEKLRQDKEAATAQLEKKLAELPKSVSQFVAAATRNGEGKKNRWIRFEEKCEIVKAILAENEGKMPYLDLRKEYESRSGGTSANFKDFVLKAKHLFKIRGKRRQMVVQAV